MKKADKSATQAKDMSGMTTTRLLYTDYYLTIRRVRNSEQQRKWKIVMENYNTSNHALKMSRNDQQPTCGNSVCENQTLTIKHCLVKCLQQRDTRKTHNIQSIIKTLLGSGKGNEVSSADRDYIFLFRKITSIKLYKKY